MLDTVSIIAVGVSVLIGVIFVFWCFCRAGETEDLNYDWRDKYLPTEDRDDA
jgi:hypothetical protein